MLRITTQPHYVFPNGNVYLWTTSDLWIVTKVKDDKGTVVAKETLALRPRRVEGAHYFRDFLAFKEYFVSNLVWKKKPAFQISRTACLVDWVWKDFTARWAEAEVMSMLHQGSSLPLAGSQQAPTVSMETRQLNQDLLLVCRKNSNNSLTDFTSRVSISQVKE